MHTERSQKEWTTASHNYILVCVCYFPTISLKNAKAIWDIIMTAFLIMVWTVDVFDAWNYARHVAPRDHIYVSVTRLAQCLLKMKYRERLFSWRLYLSWPTTRACKLLACLQLQRAPRDIVLGRFKFINVDNLQRFLVGSLTLKSWIRRSWQPGRNYRSMFTPEAPIDRVHVHSREEILQILLPLSKFAVLAER